MLKLKKILITIPVLILVVFLITTIAYAEGNRNGIINADSVNMRSTPDTSAEIIVQLSKDTKVSVLDVQEDWYKISCNGNEGWVFSEFVTIKDAVAASGIINATNVNVRNNPSTSSDVLTKLNKGTKVSIFDYSGDWCKILIEENKYGWVSKDYVTLKSSSASRGITSEIETPIKNGTEIKEDNDIRQQIVEYAKQFIGIRYRYGGTTTKGFDCSGFVQFVFKNFDIKLQRTATDQCNNGTKIDKENLKPGDLVFFDTNGGLNSIEHVGIYIGDGKFIHASSGSAHCVTISHLTEGYYQKTYMRSRSYINE